MRRPQGQIKDAQAEAPVFGPSRALDYELEVGFLVGTGNALGAPVPVREARSCLFGLCLVNDWSARDVQSWEYQPLGPFLAKNFATTVSPWVVTLDALEPFRVAAAARSPGDPAPLPYLTDPDDQARGAFDLTVEVWLRSERMRSEGVPAVRLSVSRLADLYWTPAQLIAHHTSGEAKPLTPVQDHALPVSATSVAPRFKRNSDTSTHATLRASCSQGLPKPVGRFCIRFCSVPSSSRKRIDSL